MCASSEIVFDSAQSINNLLPPLWAFEGVTPSKAFLNLIKDSVLSMAHRHSHPIDDDYAEEILFKKQKPTVWETSFCNEKSKLNTSASPRLRDDKFWRLLTSSSSCSISSLWDWTSDWRLTFSVDSCPVLPTQKCILFWNRKTNDNLILNWIRCALKQLWPNRKQVFLFLFCVAEWIEWNETSSCQRMEQV
jgi:hypothetical protein